ncbi:MAG: bifunctional 4-hydroxy-2-oxoglutarate aldolase/2-dehydro-3-deoxy-phosphogluconate aldolase [Verrucomicrobiales bacterium]|nr:bifunctional 4-hydroxy-2-oxoglutarate aldolase/2-dehydro-3-deoxy-phosphogluconate aldolase [Verrucomicrobiales bacterium]
MPSLTPTSGTGAELVASRLLAVLVVDELDTAVPLAEALLRGGVDSMELTLRTPVALDAARQITEAVPEMRVGIGTILTCDQVDQAKAAGAAFGVSPGVNPDVMRHAAIAGLPFGPGVMTPTDIDIAIREGARLLKFFPAGSSGGLAHLKNIAAPFTHLSIQFIPLGGVTLENMSDYLGDPLIAAVGGSWLAPREAIKARDWSTIEENARRAREVLDRKV